MTISITHVLHLLALWRYPQASVSMLAFGKQHGNMCHLKRLYISRYMVVHFQWHYVDGLVQDCSIPSALAMEMLQSCTKPWILQGKVIKQIIRHAPWVKFAWQTEWHCFYFCLSVSVLIWKKWIPNSKAFIQFYRRMRYRVPIWHYKAVNHVTANKIKACNIIKTIALL